MKSNQDGPITRAPKSSSSSTRSTGGSARAVEIETSNQEAVHASATDLHHLIRLAAYLRAEQRGFTPGSELHDWFEAEREVKRRFAAGGAEPAGKL